MPAWQITKDNLTLLDQIKDVEEGSLRLSATALEPATADRVVAFVRKHGNLLSALRFEPKWRMERWEFGDFDFAKECPSLDELTLGRCLVHPSVFTHPTLTELQLRESKVVGTNEIAIGTRARGNTGQPLSQVSVGNSFTAKKVVFGKWSKIRSISWSIDEDCSDATPDDFVCNGCPELRSIHLHACGSWTLDLRGTLPALSSMSFDATRYCRYELRTKGLKLDSSPQALALTPGTFGHNESDD